MLRKAHPSIQQRRGVSQMRANPAQQVRRPGARVPGGEVIDRLFQPAHRAISRIAPNTGLASAAGLDISDGIKVDDHLRTSDPDIYAAGDVANAFHPTARQARAGGALGQRQVSAAHGGQGNARPGRRL